MASEHNEYVISKQLLKSGTSIGANIEESVHAQSKADFIHKLSITQKEANETNYWLRLVKDGGYLRSDLADSLINDCTEIQKLLTASIKTAKANQKQAE